MAATTPLERVQSYQYPRAHYGHLTPEQDSALSDFKSLCNEKGYYNPAGPGGSPAASHDDETMLRYLRARKFIPKDAFEQFKDTEDWRKANQLEQLYDKIDINDYDQTRRLYPQWTGRRDKRGIPVYCFEVVHLNSKTMAAYEKSIAKSPNKTTKLIRLFALYENLVRFVLPLCSAIPDRAYPETPVSQSNNIVDISKVGLMQFWNLKAHMQDASQLATAHYPETLDRIFIIGAPSFFPTVWGWIKRWFDPITVSKIFILSAQDVKSTLETYIDPANIPKKYGGQLDWSWGDMPILEPAIQNALKWSAPDVQKGANTYPIGPIKWDEKPDGSISALAVGSIDGKARNTVIATINAPAKPVKPSRLGANLNPDPYLSGPLSTTGTHTHPEEGQSYFPPSGNTPPEGTEASDDDHSDAPAEFKSVVTEAQDPNAATLPIRTAAITTENQSTDDVPAPTRQGTSNSRLEQQDQTLAKGQLAEGTPEVIDLGHGDKTASVEPSTVGQAAKDVSVPEAAPAEPAVDTSYFGQAKAAASSAIATTTSAVGAVTGTVASAVGLGAGASQEPEESKEAEPVPKPEDPRVDQLPNSQIEEILRAQQATTSSTRGEEAVKAV